MVEQYRPKELILTSTLALMAVAACWYLSQFSFPIAARKEIKKRDKECKFCGTVGKLQSHHVCHEAIAGRSEIPYFLYHHPSNGLALCEDCHADYHRENEKLSDEEKQRLIVEMLERIVKFHRTHSQKELRAM